MSVLLETSLGNVVIDLYTEERPRCSLNFLKLCKINYYNGCLFHSVQRNLVAQTGDPSGTGRGGSSIFEQLYGEQARFFDCEILPKIYHKRRGLVSMVNNGSGQHGSQFFITLADDLDYLNNKHSVFGIVAEGEDFLSKINDAYCDKESRPYRNIRIHRAIILDDPFADPDGLEIPPSSPKFFRSYEDPDSAAPPRIEEDEDLDGEVDGRELTEAERAEREAMKEARTNAQLLTLLGDLPDVDAKPPENVLFVCRLNPVTRGEDLEIIFSRFGEILSSEVIYDRRTGNSLQYAFIEFARKEDCEEAFFKMDNVVIDDRRIHVDFSQSVAKEWFRYRREKRENALPLTHSQRRRRRYVSPLPPPRSRDCYRGDRQRKVKQRERTPESKEKEFVEATPECQDMEYLLSDQEESNSPSFPTSPKRVKPMKHSKQESDHKHRHRHRHLERSHRYK
ncbi:Peptidyl-prolyl cis-tran isomerase-like 4 [Taenia crassiceps]|uniref:Peptidyl-prolyl cis-trans isomerase n=1 Tax=Taenia crassiceps TaxID=6207 RepID=A0ABR4Q0Y4_9CEST